MDAGGAACRAIVAAVAAVVVCCNSSRPTPDAGALSATTGAAPPPRPLLRDARRPAIDANPLGLPPRRGKLAPGRRAFTFSDATLANAKLGSTMVLQAATVSGFDGDDLVVEGRTGPAYKVHPGYVITVADDARVRPGDCVIAEHDSALRHAVVVRMTREGLPVVRYTDLEGSGGGEVPLGKGARVMSQRDGLLPGNYAALRQGADLKHVLLVSPVEGAADGGSHAAAGAWFALGFGGIATIVPEAALAAIPVRVKPKVGTRMLARWLGTMREATVLAAPAPGIFTVRFDRAGRPEVMGFGLLMPFEAERPLH